MKDGTIYLWKCGDDFVGRCIRFFTKSEFGHVAIFSNGNAWESTVWEDFRYPKWQFWRHWRTGVRKITGECAGYALKREPMFELSVEQWKGGENYAMSLVAEQRPYNFLLFVALALVFWTRKFWDWVGWVPFSSRALGTICSEFVDEYLVRSAFDAFPDRSQEATTVPGDYATSSKWRDA